MTDEMARNDAMNGLADTEDEERLSKLPPEEIDEDRTVGGGMLDAGGTATTRGTGTLGGQAQGGDGDVDGDDPDDVDVAGAPLPPGPGGVTR
jgi:hypothetical protein